MNVLAEIQKRRKMIFLFLVIIAGAAVFAPALNFQGVLAPGDHGRDLYAFKKTLEGQTPYRRSEERRVGKEC